MSETPTMRRPGGRCTRCKKKMPMGGLTDRKLCLSCHRALTRYEAITERFEVGAPKHPVTSVVVPKSETVKFPELGSGPDSLTVKVVEVGSPGHPVTSVEEARYIADRRYSGLLAATWRRFVRWIKR